MQQVANNLREVVTFMRNSVMLNRPLNQDEIRQFADIIESVRVPGVQLVRYIKDSSIHPVLRNDWMKFKAMIGPTY